VNGSVDGLEDLKVHLGKCLRSYNTEATLIVHDQHSSHFETPRPQRDAPGPSPFSRFV
jgi:predicted NUDIX family NTP pyrophosphohydrolase